MSTSAECSRARSARKCLQRPARRCGWSRPISRAIPKAGTLRGLHFQAPPHEEAKLIQCVRGRVFDVAVDLRRHAPSFRRSVCTELSADGNRLFLIPKGCAHGFLTLEDNSDILYYMGDAFVPGVGQGVRWNDPAFEIPWPAAPRLISERDAAYPDFDRRRPMKRVRLTRLRFARL